MTNLVSPSIRDTSSQTPHRYLWFFGIFAPLGVYTVEGCRFSRPGNKQLFDTHNIFKDGSSA